MALEGIRLSDLYTSKEYNDWAKGSTNSRLVESTIRLNPDADPEKIKGHLYLNSRIKSSIGEEEFAKLPHMTLDEKVNWFNTNINKNQEDTLEQPELEKSGLVQNITEQKDSILAPIGEQTPVSPEEIADPSAFTVPTNGNTMYSWFLNNAQGDYTAYLEARKKEIAERNKPATKDLNPFGVATYKSWDTQQLEDELTALKESNPNNTAAINVLENSLKASQEKDAIEAENYFREVNKDDNLTEQLVDGRSGYFKPIRENEWNTKETQDTVDELTSNIRGKLDSDSTFAFDTFKSFEEDMVNYVSQYRNYHDTPALAFTPDEMKDIMAQYYSLRQLKSPEEATAFAAAMFQNRLAERQPLHEKASIAIKGFGADIAGNLSAAVGLVANMPTAIRAASTKEYDIDDLGWWKKMLYYSAQNPLTEWGNNIVTTGTWLPGLQQSYKDLEYNALQLQRESGKETEFWDINTPFEIFEQSGFTVAGMMTGTAVAQTLANSVGKQAALTATRMLAKEGAGKGTQIVAKTINALGKNLVTVGSAYLPAMAEASMDATETYNISKQQSEEAIMMGLERQLAEEYQDGTFDMWYQQNTRIPYTLDPERQMSEEEMQELSQLREQERAYLWNNYKDLRVKEELSNPETQRFIEMEAKRSAAKNMFDETTWIALGDYTISNTLGKAFKEVKKASRRALFGENINNKFKWVPEGNHYRAVAREASFGDKVRAIARGATEAGEEGFEELFQTVDSKMRQDLSKNTIASYIENRYDPQNAATVSDRIGKNWDVVRASLDENLLSDEAKYSFALGAVSAGLGSPTVFRGIRTGINTYQKTGKTGQAIKEGLKASWRNPIAENLGDLKIKYLEDTQEANDINRWISAHPEIDTLNDEAAILGFIDKQAQAIKDGDEATYRDALMGQQVATMLMLERTNPDGAKINFYERIKQLSELSASDPQARNVLDQVLNSRGDDSILRTTEGPLNEEETAVINDVRDKAQKLLNTHERLQKEIQVLDSQFGNSISTEAKEALAYSLIMQNDWSNRIDSIIKKAIDAYNEANPGEGVKPISEEELAGKNALARYGNKENIEKEYQDLLKRRAALRARRKSMYGSEYRSEFDKNTKAIRENRDAAKAIGTLEEGTVITAEEMLSLSNKERAYILDKANKKQYSKAQQREINKFMSSEGIRGDMVTDLIDAGRLQNKKEYFQDEYEALTRNNGALIPVFDREVRKEAAKTWVKAKLETAMEANTYKDFRDAMDSSLRTGEFSDNDRMIMGEIFNEEGTNKKTWEFYQRYKKEELTRRSLRGIIENSPEFKKLKDDDKKIVTDAVEQVQRDGNEVNTDSILAKLSDPEYRNQLERQGIDVSALDNARTFEELATAVTKAMEQKRVYDENATALKEAAERKSRAKKEKDPTKTPKTNSKKKESIIPKERYESNKDKLDNIFKKIANNMTRRRKQQLSSEEYRDFVNLYTDSPSVGNLLVDDLNTDLTAEAISQNIDKLEKAVQDKLYTDEKASESEEVQNTLKLAAALQGILNTVNTLRKVGTPTDVSTFIKNTILQINPNLSNEFKSSKITLDKNYQNYNSKAESSLTTKTEKDWYEKNNISKNLETLTTLPNANTEYVFLKDSKLESDLRNEFGEELDDDNLPLIIAARVPLKTPGSVIGADGHNYLYVGLLQESRMVPAAEDRNQANNLRFLALEQENDGPIMYNNRTVTFARPTPKLKAKTEDKTETTSFRDWLNDKYKNIKGDKERKDAIVEDFIKHYRLIQTTTQNGEVKGAYEWNGKTVNISWATTAPDNDKPFTRAAYIRENPDGTVTPLFLEVRRIDEINFDDEHTLYEMLNDDSIDITEPKYANNDGNFIRKGIVALKNLITNNADLLVSSKTRPAALAQLNGSATKSGKLQQNLERYFNLSKPFAISKANISIGLDVVGDTLVFSCWETGTEKNKVSAFGIPQILSSIRLDQLNDGTAVANFVREGIKTLIFDEDGNLRTTDPNNDGNQWPIIKFEDNYQENNINNTKVFNRDMVRLKLLGDMWQVRTYAIKQDAPESVKLEIKNVGPQPVVSSGINAQQKAIERITAPEFIDEHEGEHFQLASGETEVTTFIKGDDEDIDWGDTSLSGQFATNLGTSVDKMYRIWRRNGRSLQGVEEYMSKTGFKAWPGFSRLDIPLMLEQFERIDKFFKDRGEVQVDADLIFRSNVEYAGKVKYLVGKPDIITVDKNGIYHIYDMKSFRYNAGASDLVPGFKTSSFILNGKRNAKKAMDSWKKQMSMYKAMIESKLGAGTVSSALGVVPIRLGYQPQGSIDPYVVEGVGAHKLNDADGKPLHVSFGKMSTELTPSGKAESVTRCYDEPIRLMAIEKLDDINPDGWRTMSKTDQVKAQLNAAKRGPSKEAVPTTEEDLLANVMIEQGAKKQTSELSSSPEIEGPVTIHKSLKETSRDELLKSLSDMAGEEGDDFDTTFAQQLNKEGCKQV